MFESSLHRLLAAYQDTDPSLESQLEQQRHQFLDQYHPDILAKLRGTELLHLWHGRHNGEGLIYDLEFGKLTQGLGSISGGSASKFKVYRGSDGAWKKKGFGRSVLDCSQAEAMLLTEGMADDLVQGCRWAQERNLEAGNLAGWELFIADVNRMVSPLGNNEKGGNQPTLKLGWGHKYLALIHPQVFSFHHQGAQLAAHLVQLGVWPDGTFGEGRYELDYVWQKTRFQTAELRDLHPAVLMHALYDDELGFGYGPNYWRMGTTTGSQSVWPQMRAGHYVSIGWDELGDLRRQLEGLSGEAASSRIKELLKKHRPESAEKGTGKHPNEITSFYQDIKVGDRVIAMKGKQLLGVGVVASDYYFEPTSLFHHRHRVHWHWLSPDDQGEKWDKISILYSTVYNFRSNWEAALDIEARIQQHPRIEPPFEPLVAPSKSAMTPTLAAPTSSPTELLPLDAQCQRVYDVLTRKGQMILHGPPGTGKTYLARRAARELIAREVAQGRDWANLNEAQRQQVDQRIAFCTFHPAYSYEEFIEGFRPEVTPQGASFKRQDGLFLDVCQQATDTAGHVVLIIDEINRANVSAVMGELLTLLEQDKRGTLQVRLPLSRREFTVPPNLWLIGTMNTADRSIALLDAALRRRFGFMELMPEPERLDARIEGLHLGALLRELNARVQRHVPRNARSLQVGHSYFLHAGKPLGTRHELLQVMRDDIFPLLAEYCFEDYEALAQILGTEIVEVEKARFRDDVQQHGELLLNALRPLISDTWEASAEEAEMETDSPAESEQEADASSAVNDESFTAEQQQEIASLEA